MLGLPVSSTHRVSSGVTYRAWTLINVVLELLANGMPLMVVESPPGGVLIAKFGYGVSAVVLTTSPSVKAYVPLV